MIFISQNAKTAKDILNKKNFAISILITNIPTVGIFAAIIPLPDAPVL